MLIYQMIKKYILLPILAVAIGTLLPIQTYAAQFETGDYTLDTESVVEEDLYVTGDNIIVKGVVDGDLIVMGQTITIDGTVTGDLYVFGNSVSIAGSIYGNVISAGSNVSVKGTLGQNVYLAGMMVDLDANIGKDLNIASGTTKLMGSIGDDARVATGQLSSEAEIAGDMLLSTESYTLSEENIAGDFVVTTNNQKVNVQPTVDIKRGDLLGFNLGLAMISFVGMYIVGVLLIYSAPVKTLGIEKKIVTSWEELLKSFAVGLLILFMIPLPLFILVLTLVGAPLAFLITGILVFLVTFGTLWTEAAIGHKVLELFNQKDSHRYLSLLVGRLITSVVKLIPLINGFYSLLLSMVTVGAVVRMKYDAFVASKTNSTPKKKVVSKKK